MKVEITADFKCAPEGHTTLYMKAGDIVEGKAAQMALDAKAGKLFKEEKPKPKAKRTPKPKVAKKPKPTHEG